MVIAGEVKSRKTNHLKQQHLERASFVKQMAEIPNY
jgi:hypothetical protein